VEQLCQNVKLGENFPTELRSGVSGKLLLAAYTAKKKIQDEAVARLCRSAKLQNKIQNSEGKQCSGI
jgi:hypothetical protein